MWTFPPEFYPIHRRLNYFKIRGGGDDDRYYGSFGSANYNSTLLARHYPISTLPSPLFILLLCLAIYPPFPTSFLKVFGSLNENFCNLAQL